MAGDSAKTDLFQRNQLLSSVLDQLACPACHAALRLQEAALVCEGCGRHYPVVDGIPVLIADAIAGE